MVPVTNNIIINVNTFIKVIVTLVLMVWSQIQGANNKPELMLSEHILPEACLHYTTSMS